MAAIIVLQGVLGSSVTSHADREARVVLATSLGSVEQVSRIAHDIDQERILVSEHILETSPSAMDVIEVRLADLRKDVEETTRRHAPRIVLPGEAQLWAQAQLLDARFEQRIADVVVLSHANRNAEARAQLTMGQKDQMDLDGKLVELIRMNLMAAGEAMEHVRDLQERAEELQWATRIAGLSVLLVLGVWGTRRIVRYEKQLTDYALEIEERNRDLDAFAGRVAHDLRNALGPIALSPALLRSSAGSPAQVERISDRVQRCSDRAISVVDSLLAFSRAGQQAGDNESGSLAAAVRSVEEELAPSISRLGVSFSTVDVEDAQVRCTPGLLHIVLANLCGNAVKYLEGRPERRVRVCSRTEGTACRIEVDDSGPGIPQEMQARIFEPFFRVDGTLARGTGIGLATVRRVIEARAGRIEVQSEVGKGCRFVVWLPLATGALVDARVEAASQAASAKAEL